MKAKSTFQASNGQTSRLWRTGDGICQGSALPRLPIRAKLDLNLPIIRWMLVDTHQGSSLAGMVKKKVLRKFPLNGRAPWPM
jgi:hypothetical protein